MELTPDQQARLGSAREVRQDSYEAYLRGMYYLKKGTLEDSQRGLSYLFQAIENDPADPLAYATLAMGYIMAAHGPEPPLDALPRAKAAAERALSLEPSNQVVLGTSANGYAKVGMEKEARRILEQLLQHAQTDYVDPFYVAIIHVALGEHDRAFELLRECIEVRSMSTLFIKHFRWTEPLRSDPRFQEILELAFGSSP